MTFAPGNTHPIARSCQRIENGTDRARFEARLQRADLQRQVSELEQRAKATTLREVYVACVADDRTRITPSIRRYVGKRGPNVEEALASLQRGEWQLSPGALVWRDIINLTGLPLAYLPLVFS